MDDLINDFIAETREMLQALAGEIVAWEATPDDRKRLDEIFRFVHTVKGNSGFFDLPRLAALSHAAEDALAEVRAGRRAPDAALVSAVLAVIDRIGELIQALETGEALASEDDAQLIAALAPGAAAPAAGIAEPHPTAPLDQRKAQRSIRLSVDLLDRMMSGVSDAVLARNELARRLRETPADLGIEAAFDRVSSCIAEIRDAITRTRMQRIDSLFAGLPRMVRDISCELGKQVRLDVDGGDVELDREMIEMIRDPLTHMVRNAIDHGIEPARDRVAAGKDAAGSLSVCARQAGNQILIEVVDDGNGIDADRLVKKALANGVITPERAERLTGTQKMALMFEAGLSTAEQVSAISGRGVGMDVVRANVERIGGLVEVDSRLGRGARFTIRVPLTLTIIPALTIQGGGQTFAIPRSAIVEILRVGSDAVRVDRVGEAQVATVRGQRMPMVALCDLLGVAPVASDCERRIILIKPAGGNIYALNVAAVEDHEELVVKPAAPAVMSVGIYAGTTLADDGRPVLLLDPSGMAAKANLRAEERDEPHRAPQGDPASATEEGVPLLLFHMLGGAVRAIRLALVERIEDVSAAAVRRTGGRLHVTLDGRILPLLGAAEAPEEGKLRILRISDGADELAFAFADVIDILPLSAAVQPVAVPGMVAGIALIGGEQVELIDPYWLFEQAGRAAAPARPRVCAITAGDAWLDNMLRPMIESLGYRVVTAGPEATEQADVVIASADAPLPDAPPGAQLLRLAATPAAADGADIIYRYDRAALLAALSGAGRERRHG